MPCPTWKKSSKTKEGKFTFRGPGTRFYMTSNANTADTYAMKKGAQLSNWVLLKVTEGPFKGNEIEIEGFEARFELGLYH